MSGEQNPRPQGEPQPDFVDFLETRAEQGCISLGIVACGAAVALLLFVLGAVAEIAVLKGAALIIVILAVGTGIFFGHDVNYMVRRMRDRARDRNNGQDD